jgi:hypothetical protein
VCWLSSYHLADTNCSDRANGVIRLIVVPNSDRREVGPFAKGRLNEALSFAVGPRSVWLGEYLANTEASADGPERL